MKQLLFLLLFPAFAMAQYQGNANQKITLGEQTTADGLVWRGRLADTANLLTNKLDTSVYIVLDTGTRAMWYYRVSTTPKWTRLVDSLNNLQGQLSLTSKVTGTLPVANGGTNTSTAFTAGSVVFAGASGTYSQDNNNLFWNNTNKNLGIGTNSPNNILQITAAAGSSHARWTESATTVGFVGGANGIITGLNGSFAIRGESGLVLSGAGNAANLYINSSGNVGIGTTSPTAALHLKAGTATANTAPLKFTSGTNLTTAEAGAMEFNGTNLFFSPSTTRHTVNHGLTGSATLDFPSTTTLLSADLTITVTGAADGDIVSLGVPNAAVNANTSYSAWVSAANTVTVRFNNYSSFTVNPASGTFKVFLTK